MSFSPSIVNLVNSLRVLPGVGQKSAQRMALHLLERDRSGALALANSLVMAMESVKRCQSCRTFSDTDICPLCENSRRDSRKLCVVETPSDLFAVESVGQYDGKFFVLMGHLSPIEGIGPDEIGIDQLMQRVKEGEVEEVILATNPTVEGEATAHFIADLLGSSSILVTRLAHGIPIGGELGYTDGGTLAHAFQGRKPL
ncbi:MAG: recombination protein RecR [Hahellaceae bacterium]|nr:recombination protein RecR [Hahellaceae bacterium]MCP5212149.1 recombination protein RecR [Hahellaceae bacterium]